MECAKEKPEGGSIGQNNSGSPTENQSPVDRVNEKVDLITPEIPKEGKQTEDVGTEQTTGLLKLSSSSPKVIAGIVADAGSSPGTKDPSSRKSEEVTRKPGRHDRSSPPSTTSGPGPGLQEPPAEPSASTAGVVFKKSYPFYSSGSGAQGAYLGPPITSTPIYKSPYLPLGAGEPAPQPPRSSRPVAAGSKRTEPRQHARSGPSTGEVASVASTRSRTRLQHHASSSQPVINTNDSSSGGAMDPQPASTVSRRRMRTMRTRNTHGTRSTTSRSATSMNTNTVRSDATNEGKSSSPSDQTRDLVPDTQQNSIVCDAATTVLRATTIPRDARAEVTTGEDEHQTGEGNDPENAVGRQTMYSARVDQAPESPLIGSAPGSTTPVDVSSPVRLTKWNHQWCYKGPKMPLPSYVNKFNTATDGSLHEQEFIDWFHENDGFPLKFLVEYLGVFPETKHRNDGTFDTPGLAKEFPIYTACVMVDPKLGVCVPAYPGLHGAMISGLCRPRTTFPLFVHGDNGTYKYMGTYREPRGPDRMSGSETLDIPTHVKQYWAGYLGDDGQGGKSAEQIDTLRSICLSATLGWHGGGQFVEADGDPQASKAALAAGMKRMAGTMAPSRARKITAEEVLEAFHREDASEVKDGAARLWWQYLEFLLFDDILNDMLNAGMKKYEDKEIAEWEAEHGGDADNARND